MFVGRLVAVGCVVLSGCSTPAEGAEDDATEAGAVNVDPEGVYAFGDEQWILATNADTPYGEGDYWTNSRNEGFFIRPLATLTGGQTAQTQCQNDFDLNYDLFQSVVFPPEYVEGAPGWCWYAITFSTFDGVLYEAQYVETPRGFDVEFKQEGGDPGRLRAASVLSTLEFL